MSQTVEFYQQRAKEAADEAREATLENVRLRALRSEAAWLVMAGRASEIAAGRNRKAIEAALAGNSGPEHSAESERQYGSQ